MNIYMDDLHRRWLETPCQPVLIDEIPDPSRPRIRSRPTRLPPPMYGGPAPANPVRAMRARVAAAPREPVTPEKDQAGSFARDAEQDPQRERHDRSDAGR